MIDVFFVLDGTRDYAIVPHLVSRILAANIRPQCGSWARLHADRGTSGYRRKFLFALRQAQDAGAAALVATVDKDKAPKRERLKELLKAREEHRASTPAFPAAIGEAVPHCEAWLLDDAVAVRRALMLDADVQVPNVVKIKSPKDIIDGLKRQSTQCDEQIQDVLAGVAKLVDLHRCRHAKDTGFQAFVQDVRRELGPTAVQCGDECRCGDACEHTSSHG